MLWHAIPLHFPPFPPPFFPVFPRFSPFFPVFPHFSPFSPIFPIFPIFPVPQKRLGDSGVGDFQGLLYDLGCTDLRQICVQPPNQPTRPRTTKHTERSMPFAPLSLGYASSPLSTGRLLAPICWPWMWSLSAMGLFGTGSGIQSSHQRQVRGGAGALIRAENLAEKPTQKSKNYFSKTRTKSHKVFLSTTRCVINIPIFWEYGPVLVMSLCAPRAPVASVGALRER